MKLYLCMLFCGGICTVLYYLINKATPYEMSLSQRSIFLRMNVLLYLVPYPLLVFQGKVVLVGIIRMLHFDRRISQGKYVSHLNSWNESLMITSGRIVQTITGHKVFLLIDVGIAFIILASLIYRCVGHCLLWSKIKKDLIVESDYTLGKRKISVATSSFVNSPATIGIFKHVVVLPIDQTKLGTQKEAIIKHELQHVKGNDGLFLFLSRVVLSVHWINPLVHYMFRELSTINECISDQAATEGMGKNAKREYMDCILESAKEDSLSDRYTLGLRPAGKIVNERMNRIMGNNLKKIFNRYFALAIAAVAFVGSSVPALAYEESAVYEEDSATLVWNNVNEIKFLENVLEDVESEVEDIDFSNSDSIFVDAYGNVYPIVDMHEGRVFCFHDYVEGTVYIHHVLDGGSCQVEVFRAKRCTICNKIVQGERLATHNYYVCPHPNGEL